MDKKIIKIKIKRNNFDVKNIDNQIKFTDSPLPQSCYFIYLIIGIKGTGKSTVILNVLNNKKVLIINSLTIYILLVQQEKETINLIN